MRKCKITVRDYNDAIHGYAMGMKPQVNTTTYEVEAWCVGGDYGVRAFFFIGDQFCTADGDDGHWWLVNACNKAWLQEIKEAIVAASEEGK